MKTNNLYIRLTDKQKEILLKKTLEHGFTKISEFIRYRLFLDCEIHKKLDLLISEVRKDDKHNENNIFSQKFA